MATIVKCTGPAGETCASVYKREIYEYTYHKRKLRLRGTYSGSEVGGVRGQGKSNTWFPDQVPTFLIRKVTSTTILTCLLCKFNIKNMLILILKIY